MNKTFTKALKDAKENGIKLGVIAFGAGALIAAYNVNENADKRYMSKSNFKKFFLEWEKEVERLFERESEKCGYEEFSIILIEKTKILRKEMGIDGED